MENNNLSLYLEEAEKERAAKNLSNYVKEERLRLKKVRRIKRNISILSATLFILLIFIISYI